MLVRATRWFMIVAPVAAGILVLILGTAGSISTTFGIVLIGLGPIIWMWNFFLRMSFDEEDEAPEPPVPERQALERQPRSRLHRAPAGRHPRPKLSRLPRRPS